MIGVQGIPQSSTPEEVSPTANLLQNALNGYQNIVKSAYTQPLSQQNLQQQIADTLIKQAQAQYANPMEQAKLSAEQQQAPYIQSEATKNNANAGLFGQQAAEQQIKNQYLPQREPAEIGEIQARSNFYNQGGGRMGVGAKEQQFYQSLVQQDNPHLRPDQIYEASNVLALGGTKLTDGTPVMPLSPASQASLARINKGTTTSPLITQGVRANQAEAELQSLSQATETDIQPYAHTIMGISPKQIADTFRSDDDSQTRLGKLMAAQAMQNEIAQIRSRMAGGVQGITAIQDLMQRSGQLINTKYPNLSAKARQVANDTIDEYLKNGLSARQAVGVSPTQLTNYSSQPPGTANIGNRASTAAQIGNTIGNYDNGGQTQATSGSQPIAATAAQIGNKISSNPLLPANTNSNVRNAITTTANNFKSIPIRMIDKQGKEWDVPQGNAQIFIDNGYKRKANG